MSTYKEERDTIFYALNVDFPSFNYRSNYRESAEQYWYYVHDEIPTKYTSYYGDGVNNYWTYLYEAQPLHTHPTSYN